MKLFLALMLIPTLVLIVFGCRASYGAIIKYREMLKSPEKHKWNSGDIEFNAVLIPFVTIFLYAIAAGIISGLIYG